MSVVCLQIILSSTFVVDADFISSEYESVAVFPGTYLFTDCIADVRIYVNVKVLIFVLILYWVFQFPPHVY